MAEPRDPLLQEREKTHGDFRNTAKYATEMKKMFRGALAGKARDYRHGEALDMIATKIARLLSGDIKHKDTWIDIAGYAKLGAEACD